MLWTQGVLNEREKEREKHEVEREKLVEYGGVGGIQAHYMQV